MYETTCTGLGCGKTIYDRRSRIASGLRKSTKCRACGSGRTKGTPNKVIIEKYDLTNELKVINYYASGNEDMGVMARQYFKGETK